MIEIATCPDAARLRNLLDGRLSDEEQTRLDRHLEGCPNCQQRLEGLAAGTETWTAAARNLPAGLVTPEAGLERILAESTEEEPAEPETPPAETPLDFLSPPDDPAHLGRLGSYQILSVIGRGGMSVVLKAFDPSLQRVVAIKVLAPQLATSAAARTRFQREGFAAAAISHEHVVGVYAVDEINGLPYLVMEYISGESLQERLDRQGPLELKEVLRIGMQTAQGLAAAHAQGLVHRDIKPANILLHNGVARVKITDFGLARAVDDATLTQSGLIAGTPQYMSPEQARGDVIDARTDLFSLGSVLYAMCAGRPPFRASTTMGVLKRVSDENPRDVREVHAEVPLWLADIIAKLHAKNPAERFQSAAEVTELLSRYLAGTVGGTVGWVERSETHRATQHGSPQARWVSLRSTHPTQKTHPTRKWAFAAGLLAAITGMFVVGEATGVTNVTEYMATVLRIKTPEGTLVIETDDPGIEVVVDNEDITIHGAGPKEIRVRAGDHRIRATKDGKEVPVEEPLVTVTRGGKAIVKIRQEKAQGEASAPKASPTTNLAGSKNTPDLFREIAVLRGHEGVVRALAFTPDGKALISAGGGPDGPATDANSGELRRWDIAQRKEVWSVATPSIVFAAALSPGGMELTTAEGDGTVRHRDSDTGQVVNVFRGHKGPAYTVAREKNSQIIASAGLDRTIKVWRLGTKELLESFDSGNTKQVNCLAFSPDGKTLAVGGQEVNPSYPASSGSYPQTIHKARLFTVGSWKVRAVLAGHVAPIRQLAFSPDGKYLVTADDDGRMRIWNVADGKLLLHTSGGIQGKIRCLAFAPDGSMLAAGGEKSLIVHRFNGRGKYLLGDHLLTIWSKSYSLAFSPDSRTLAYGCADGTIKLWDITVSQPSPQSGTNPKR